VLVDQKEAFEKYHEQIVSIYRRYNMIDVIHQGGYLTKFSNSVGHLRPKYNLNGQIDFQEQDLYNIVHETRFAIANTVLLSEIGLTPFLINHIYDPVPLFSPTVVDIRFFYFIDDAFMRLYNFWNRVANFLNIFFQIETNPEKVLFPSLIEKLASRVGNDLNFKSLQEFKEKEYKDIINRKRRKVVHRESSSSTYFKSFLDSLAKNFKETSKLQEQLRALQRERDELPPYFVTSYKRMIQGLDEMLALIRDNVK